MFSFTFFGLIDMDPLIYLIYHVDGVFRGHAHNFEAFYCNKTYFFTLGN